MPHIDPTSEQFLRIVEDAATIATPIRMLNLLKFRDIADYGDTPDPAGDDGPSTGAEAYGRYGEFAAAAVASVGGSFFYYGMADMTVIGPETEDWDVVAIVEYPSRAAFIEMTSKPSYGAGVFHRTAGLADTRIIMTSFSA